MLGTEPAKQIVLLWVTLGYCVMCILRMGDG